jgi:hypothetical protein
MSYYSLATSGMVSMVMLVIGGMLSIATTIFLGFEQSASDKKKKKKKDDECMEPVTKTMTLNVCAFMFSSGGVALFTCHLGTVLKDFQQTAYYPFAGAHAGGFVGGFGAFLLFISMLIASNRAFRCCGKKKDDNDPMMNAYGEQGAYGQGAYGPPPGAYGAPPGAYGYPPGAYGGYPPQ